MLTVLVRKFRAQTLDERCEQVSSDDEWTPSADDTHEQTNFTFESAMATSSVTRERNEQSLEVAGHSSEEELEVINKGSGGVGGQGQDVTDRMAAEKRKWTSDGCSSDDEVRDLMQFGIGRSPPPSLAANDSGNNSVVDDGSSRPAKLFHFAAPLALSPRKRQRHSANLAPRPCLDFEKMQQLRTRAVSNWRTGREVSLIC